jgi:hypothetical protein
LNEISKERYVAALHRALICVGLVEKEQAFDWLEKAYEEHFIVVIKVFPSYDPLRSDPRFADLLRRMNLQP